MDIVEYLRPYFLVPLGYMLIHDGIVGTHLAQRFRYRGTIWSFLHPNSEIAIHRFRECSKPALFRIQYPDRLPTFCRRGLTWPLLSYDRSRRISRRSRQCEIGQMSWLRNACHGKVSYRHETNTDRAWHPSMLYCPFEAPGTPFQI